MREWRLYIGGNFTGIVLRPDAKYPKMWRIHGNNQVSDMVNINRAKDAAVMWARPRGLGGTEEAQWRIRETASKGRTAA
jgi:hypothetical protein